MWENVNNDTRTDGKCMGDEQNDTVVYGFDLLPLLYHTIANLDDVWS